MLVHVVVGADHGGQAQRESGVVARAVRHPERGVMDAALGEGEGDGALVGADGFGHAVAVDVPVVGEAREIAGDNSVERAREG